MYYTLRVKGKSLLGFRRPVSQSEDRRAQALKERRIILEERRHFILKSQWLDDSVEVDYRSLYEKLALDLLREILQVILMI